jgi:hypothetical protein
MDDSALLVFAHIPKTAGSTLVQVIQRQFRPSEMLSYEDEFWATRIPHLADRAGAGLNGIRCVMGHIPFGVHNAIGREVTYVTMLRDPVEWTLSCFSFIKERLGTLPDDGTFPQRAVFADVPRMSLEGFVQFMDNMGLANYQTRFVSGHLDLRSPLPPHERLPQAAIELAKANLFASRTSFGLVEHFDLSLLLFKKRLGWRNVYYRKANVTERRTIRTHVPVRALARIQDLHAIDIQLYETAANAFWNALKQQGLHRTYSLYRFRAANTGYRLLGDGVRRLRMLARRTLSVAATR